MGIMGYRLMRDMVSLGWKPQAVDGENDARSRHPQFSEVFQPALPFIRILLDCSTFTCSLISPQCGAAIARTLLFTHHSLSDAFHYSLQPLSLS
jgi:hypothetical protein